MLWTICVVLIILWLLGLVTGTTRGGLIHVLLVVATPRPMKEIGVLLGHRE